MSMLESIQTGLNPRPRRVLVYGIQGVGKSTFAAAAPSPIFLPTEDGLGDISCHRLPLASSYQECLDAIGALYTESHRYQTFVIDTVDWLERLIWSDVCDKRGVNNIEDIGYAKGYTFALTQWREILSGLDALRNERGMIIVLLSHSKIEKFHNPECDHPYDRYEPRLNRHSACLIVEWCDEVLFAGQLVLTRVSDEGFGRKKARGIGTGERILRTTERPAHLAKNRLNLPDELPLDWNEYAKYFTTKSATSQVAASRHPASVRETTA